MMKKKIEKNQELIVVMVYYFQIWNKKEHNIIICRVISSHIGPLYIETSYSCYSILFSIVLDWESFQ